MSSTQPDWELSKENIQPLKSGRKASKLENISKPKDLKALNEERMQYESELRVYDGNDPLDPWYRSVIIYKFSSNSKIFIQIKSLFSSNL